MRRVRSERSPVPGRNDVLAGKTLCRHRIGQAGSGVNHAKPPDFTEAENRPFEPLKVGTCLGQIRGCGDAVDEKWLIDTLTTALANAQRA